MPRLGTFNLHQLRWVVHLVGVSSTLLLILVNITSVNVVEEPEVFDTSRLIEQRSSLQPLRTTLINKELKDKDDNLFRIHKILLSSRHQGEWKHKLTGSFPIAGITRKDEESKIRENTYVKDSEVVSHISDGRKKLRNATEKIPPVQPSSMNDQKTNTNRTIVPDSGILAVDKKMNRQQISLVREKDSVNLVQTAIKKVDEKPLLPIHEKHTILAETVVGRPAAHVKLNKSDVNADKPNGHRNIDPLITYMPDLNIPPVTEDSTMLTTGKHLMILSYMRSGSSMNGNVFKDNEEDFYVYEPLIKFAPYHFFTENRLCKMREPKCMTTDLDGFYVEDRIETAVRTLKNLYSCNIRGLDDRILRSIMFENKSGKALTNFTKCYVTLAENNSVDNFDEYIINAKEKDFEKHKHVLRHLYSPGRNADTLNSCIDQLETKCRTSKIRVTKILRLSARLVPRLLNTFPNLKILFVLRDPRGIVNSRIETPWFPVSRGKPNEVRDNINSLCYKMVSDVKMVQSIKRNFPGRLIDFRLEDIVKNPSEIFDKIFDFMNATMTDSHKSNIKMIFKEKPNFQRKWITSLRMEYISLIEDRCKELFSYYKYFRMTSDVK